MQLDGQKCGDSQARKMLAGKRLVFIPTGWLRRSVFIFQKACSKLDGKVLAQKYGTALKASPITKIGRLRGLLCAGVGFLNADGVAGND